MTIWMGAVQLPPGRELRFTTEAGAWLLLQPLDAAASQWRVSTNTCDNAGRPLLKEAQTFDAKSEWYIGSKAAFIRLTPLKAGQVRASTAPPTEPNDLLLEVRAFHSDGTPALDIQKDRIVSHGMFLKMSGPLYPASKS
jgi:hypothetical protein